jgi:cell division protein FtsW
MDTQRTAKHVPDMVLLATVMFMCVFGLLMVFSASMSEPTPDPRYYFGRQLLAFVVGLAAMLVAYSIDYRNWKRVALLLFLGTIVILVVVLFFGEERNGSKSWFLNGSFQPSEVAKLAIVLFCAAWLPTKGDDLRTLGYGLVPFSLMIGAVGVLVVAQPDLGTAAIVLLSAGAMFVMAGADALQSVTASVFGLAGATLFVFLGTHQRYRIDRFWDPCNPNNPRLEQVCQGITAMGSGGLLGFGLGSSRWRWDIASPYSDSILAIIGEELGLIGTIGVILVFVLLAYRGWRIALQTQDPFGRLLAAGITLWMVIQASINIGGNVAALPFTGVTLPFISYGGSSLVVSMFAIGILLDISRQTQNIPVLSRDPIQRTTHAPNDYGRRNSRARLPGTVRGGSTARHADR